MENNNSNNGGGKFLNGFLLGALIGGGLVFLLSTKKGKKIVKSFSENGLDNISKMLNPQDDNVEEKYEEASNPIKNQSSDTSHSRQNQTHTDPEASNGEAKHQAVEKKPLVRRFFRGIRKR